MKVYKMNTETGSLGTTCPYTSSGYANRETTAKETWGWGAYRNETIVAGEGFVVANGHTEDVKFQVSGEVVVTPMVAVPQGLWGIVGNNTPVDRVLGDFKVCNPNGDEYNDKSTTTTGGTGRCRNGVVKVYKMNIETGSLANPFPYTSSGYANRETTAKETWGWGANRNEEVKAGEALVIANGHSEEVQLKLKGPLEQE